MQKEFEMQKEAKDDPFQRRKGFRIVAAVRHFILSTTNERKHYKLKYFENSSFEKSLRKNANADETKAKEEAAKAEAASADAAKKLVPSQTPSFDELAGPRKMAAPSETSAGIKTTSISDSISSNGKTTPAKASGVNDLFHAHNFEINIDLAVPVTRERLLFN